MTGKIENKTKTNRKLNLHEFAITRNVLKCLSVYIFSYRNWNQLKQVKMKIPTVSRCCCCVELRTAGIILGVLGVLFPILAMISGEHWINHGKSIGLIMSLLKNTHLLGSVRIVREIRSTAVDEHASSMKQCVFISCGTIGVARFRPHS